MPTAISYPGVYIEEIPSGVRTITGVATSITAFVGRARRGPVDDPVRIQSFSDYERVFGGLWEKSTMSYAVRQFFLNGGTDALIVRVTADDVGTPTIPLAGAFILEAANPGEWGKALEAEVDYKTKDASKPQLERDPDLFNLTIREKSIDDPKSYRFIETFNNVSVAFAPESPRYVSKVLEHESSLVRVKPGSTRPSKPIENPYQALFQGDADGSDIKDEHIVGSELNKSGLYALRKADLFNLLCIPPLKHGSDISSNTREAAAKFCEERRAFFIADAPVDWKDVDAAEDGVTKDISLFMPRHKNAAVFFPRIKAQDPLKENRLEEFAPCGMVAGIFARTDAQRGVWKAPAGLDATLMGAQALSYKMTDGENGRLNPLGINCLRTFPVIGNIIWGSRTLKGADILADDWKYIPVRRLALYLEESLYRGTQWVVFEPNDEPLWAQIRLNIGAFMQNLFRQGAFQGKSPREAYFVKCDSETTTQNDINLGIVNIVVGFAPLKPAEFVVIKLQQMAGQIQV